MGEALPGDHPSVGDAWAEFVSFLPFDITFDGRLSAGRTPRGWARRPPG
jgi:hypothetical protein